MGRRPGRRNDVRMAAVTPVRGAVPDAGSMLGGGLEAGGRIEATSDRMEYDKKTGVFDAQGHAVIRKGTDELVADRVKGSMESGDVDAVGNVVLRRASGTWKGDRLHYNFKTRVGDCDRFTLDLTPYQIHCDQCKKVGTNYYEATASCSRRVRTRFRTNAIIT